ncbi:NADH-quinone oxidoreductase subunit A [Tuwongella immobilis]|uniref:NADH-quinone oxidoreductase subunit A n=1 Tax=Tuwongella immobilis TaxID=692036 RepID=A0A6C2YH89_9BACT|nr:NADH-quinone oxidoreductase subunit A [Tuwongella immobilis]VIP00890.1 nadh-ubiquinone plastoquinone oxidoreductase chain 3 : NADH-quinone oxidoreductase subunit OS=Planctomyces limnophilus (strain ATCC 43296 / DSM 3776 / IFAM 1008 / 290) GN=Plim_3856 PE=3 SV=1: Oxidored_q4 [Tuwongella immobilis]VTR97198.1 nadh-ubiquinone plastoquinone oxidoreductase chain 3 : NADH-quinone oxidoreductase subunit OS=Planctomyces limnophilus (strain ATCC 43296 / DSM 3776 / IFAM 1008 / 290) GN=Plim_3856 PE=3 SV=1
MALPEAVQTAAGLEPAFDLTNYFPIFIYMVVVVGFAITALLVTHLPILKPNRPTKTKLMPYESGMDPIGSAQMQFDVKFYLIAILFLVFDVELLFLYPWATIAYTPANAGPDWRAAFGGVVLIEILFFLMTLAVAYIYAWRKGVFQWR